MAPLVRIGSHEVKGKILVATQACHAGQEILREKPIIIVQDRNHYAAYKAFLAQPPAVKVRAPLSGSRSVTNNDCPCHVLTQELILSFFSSTRNSAELRELALYLNFADVEEFAKVAAIFNLNCAGV